jgi:chromosome partitioning protein
MKIIAISNYKGGVGKTTSTANIGAEMARAGLRVLLVDMDPQGSLSFSLGAKGTTDGIVDAILQGTPAKPVHIRERLDLVTSDRRMVGVELSVKKREILADIIKPLRKGYDVALLDCPPHLGILHLSALLAADYIVTPVEPEVLSLKGYRDYVEMMADIGIKPGLVFVTKYDGRKAIHRSIKGVIEMDLGDRVLDTAIRSNVALAEAPAAHKPVREHSPNSAGAADYMALAGELITRLKLLK